MTAKRLSELLFARAHHLMIAVWVLGLLFWWGLAFYPFSQEVPAWLSVARSVCFGAVDNGLPNTAGWIMLTLGPLGFLFMGFAIWPKELKNAALSYTHSNIGRAAILALSLIVVLEAGWVAKGFERASRFEVFNYANPSEEDLPESYPRTDTMTEDFTLVDQSGSAFSLADHKDETILLTFAFAHCQTVCPLLVRQALEVGQEYKNSVRVVVLTLDPWRDTPSSLPFLAEKWSFHDKAHILSGDVKKVTAVLDQFKVPYQRNERTGDVAHPALIYIIEPGGKIAFTFNDAPNRWLRQAIERILNHGSITKVSR